MASLIADHDPAALLTEVNALLPVDWPALWAGIPTDTARRDQWCEGFGWQPLWESWGLWVRTRDDGRLHLAAAGAGRPVVAVEYNAWQVRGDSADQNPELMAAATDRYHAHLTALRTVLGEPRWEGAWDAPDFPEPPAPGRWPTPERRLRHQDPHRLAGWAFSTPGAPVIALTANLGPTTAGTEFAGGASVNLTFHGPADPEPVPRAGWLL
ncbi:hypothetical protein NX801_04985 [Streptomyces sp. LP05-1]|uniref:Uncharacterized protein n=1 Tax=Streptomyces pyxinae TaxID=2970734 RepID=A0ABT2CC81_9ACTN|nr:hypothetical protein [Streptomyces sp. LP05-1]MCS0635022.1 hypothetical protein [Streptomyces sp. LP05-1]